MTKTVYEFGVRALDRDEAGGCCCNTGEEWCVCAARVYALEIGGTQFRLCPTHLRQLYEQIQDRLPRR